MTLITPIRIATVLGAAALLAAALVTTAAAEPGDPATEAAIAAQQIAATASDKRSPDTHDTAAIAAQRTAVTAADKRSPDTKDATGSNPPPTRTPQVLVAANDTVFDWKDAAIGAVAGFAIALLLGGMILLSHRGRHGSLAV